MQQVRFLEGPLHRDEEDFPVPGDLLLGIGGVGHGDGRVHVGPKGPLQPVLDHVPQGGRFQEDLIKEEEAAYRERGEAPPEGALVAVRNEAGWEGYLEAGSLRPIIKSYREWADDPDRVPSPRLFVYAKGNHSDAYLRHGEETAIPLRTSVGARSPWWKLSPLTPPTAIVPAGVDREYLFLPNQKGFLIDKRLYGLFHVEPVVVRLMNTALFKLSLEVLVRTGLGGGLADFTVYEYKQGLLLNPKLLPDPDAEATDTQVAKILGLNDQERRELLLALEQLIRERVSRANT